MYGLEMSHWFVDNDLQSIDTRCNLIQLQNILEATIGTIYGNCNMSESPNDFHNNISQTYMTFFVNVAQVWK